MQKNYSGAFGHLLRVRGAGWAGGVRGGDRGRAESAVCGEQELQASGAF